MPRTAPSTIYANTFGGINKETCTLEVPSGTTESYQMADFWSEFIFFKESDFTTSLLTTVNNRVKVYSTQSNIVVEGTIAGETISLITAGGVQLKSIKSTGERIIISAPQGTTYLVKTATKTVKVAL